MKESTMEIKLLGSLEAWHDGVSILPTAGKPRQVLALLAICAGEVVPVSALIDELWGDGTAPRSAIQVVQTYILRLRQGIDNAGQAGSAKHILTTRQGGYLLDVPHGDIDAHRFHKLALNGEQALESGDHHSAARQLGAALECWRGPALVDVRVGTRLGIEVERLNQSRLSVLESRIDADLRLGRHHKLLGELAELTARYPLHEKLCEQYMTALYRCGCKWRALEIFQRLRQRLVDELGIEPSGRVRSLQYAILNSDLTPLETAAPRRRVPLGAAG